MADFPVINGITPSWADILVSVSPESAPILELGDIKAINTDVTVELGEQRSGGRVVKRTTGSVSYDLSMTLYRTGYQKLLRALAAVAPSQGNKKRVSLVHFGLEIQHTPPNDSEIYVIRCKGVRYLGRAANDTEGTDPNEVEVKLSAIEIVDVIDGEEIVAL